MVVFWVEAEGPLSLAVGGAVIAYREGRWKTDGRDRGEWRADEYRMK